MAKFKMTILDMFRELQSFIKIPEDIIARAKGSSITTNNNLEFKSLTQAWVAGDYDEDPDLLRDSLISLLTD